MDPAPDKAAASAAGGKATSATEGKATSSKPKKPERKAQIQLVGENKSKDPVYLANIQTSLMAKADGTYMLTLNDFVTAAKAGVDANVITVSETPANSMDLDIPVLTVKHPSKTVTSCGVLVKSKKPMIQVPPGGTITITIAGNVGDQPPYDVGVNEAWLEKDGTVPVKGLTEMYTNLTIDVVET